MGVRGCRGRWSYNLGNKDDYGVSVMIIKDYINIVKVC